MTKKIKTTHIHNELFISLKDLITHLEGLSAAIDTAPRTITAKSVVSTLIRTLKRDEMELSTTVEASKLSQPKE